jgi:TetR/AcrR family transcriptional regulator, regulator of cefoperazone and chloramphenicol sensitivity
MRSTEPDDATTRARIRDAAIALFGRDGFRETTIRAIAREVGVSPALVIHHFGTKDQLRQACDEYVLAEISTPGEVIGNGEGPEASTTIRNWLAQTEKHRPWLLYIARLLGDGSVRGDQLFDELVAYTERMFEAGVADGSVRASSDPHMRAVTLTAYGMSALLLERQFGRVVGATELNAAAAERMAIPALELFTHGVYTTDTLLRATREALASREGIPK